MSECRQGRTVRVPDAKAPRRNITEPYSVAVGRHRLGLGLDRGCCGSQYRSLSRQNARHCWAFRAAPRFTSAKRQRSARPLGRRDGCGSSPKDRGAGCRPCRSSPPQEVHLPRPHRADLKSSDLGPTHLDLCQKASMVRELTQAERALNYHFWGRAMAAAARAEER
jgi:hypothetical protein